METRPIGRTGLKVTSVSFGCASIGNLYRRVSDADARTVLDLAWQNGIRYFDTAPFYGRGRSETRLGQFLSDKPRDDFVVSSKVGRLLTPSDPMAEADGFVDPLPFSLHHDYSGDGIERSFEESCERMGLSRIDILFVHDLGTFAHGDANRAHQETFLASGLDRLIRLKEQGRIRAFGLGVNETRVCHEILDAGPLDVILLAGRVTLLDRSGEVDLVPRCMAEGVSLVLGGVFNSGILATGPVPGATYDYMPASPEILEKVSDLQDRAEALGMTLAQAALHFAHSHPAAASVLLGAGKPSSLARNLDALNTLPPEGADALFGHPAN